MRELRWVTLFLLASSGCSSSAATSVGGVDTVLEFDGRGTREIPITRSPEFSEAEARLWLLRGMREFTSVQARAIGVVDADTLRVVSAVITRWDWVGVDGTPAGHTMQVSLSLVDRSPPIQVDFDLVSGEVHVSDACMLGAPP